jgi:hypothetical protein
MAFQIEISPGPLSSKAILTVQNMVNRLEAVSKPHLPAKGSGALEPELRF